MFTLYYDWHGYGLSFHKHFSFREWPVPLKCQCCRTCSGFCLECNPLSLYNWCTSKLLLFIINFSLFSANIFALFYLLSLYFTNHCCGTYFMIVNFKQHFNILGATRRQITFFCYQWSIPFIKCVSAMVTK